MPLSPEFHQQIHDKILALMIETQEWLLTDSDYKKYNVIAYKKSYIEELLWAIANSLISEQEQNLTPEKIGKITERMQRGLHAALLDLLTITVIKKLNLHKMFPNMAEDQLIKSVQGNYLTEYIIVDTHSQKHLRYLKRAITPDKLRLALTELMQNMIGIIMKSVLGLSHKDYAALVLQQADIDPRAYELLYLSKRLGIKIGFTPGYKVCIPLIQHLHQQGLYATKVIGYIKDEPNEGTKSVNGINWMKVSLAGFLQNIDGKKEQELYHDTLAILHTYQLALKNNNDSLSQREAKFDSSPKEQVFKSFNEELELSRTHRDGKPIVFAGGWPGHAIGIALYKNILIICNRGNKAGFEIKGLALICMTPWTWRPKKYLIH